MSIGDERILENGRIERVVSETPIKNYCTETPEQEKARIKKGLPAPVYSYIAVKTEIETTSGKKAREKEAKDLLKMSDEKRRKYYERILPKLGKDGVNELIAEVKKQRRLSQQKEMAL